MNLYEFKPEDVERFASSQGIKTRISHEQMQFTWCPYCHGGGGKDKNTFYISMRTGQFECKRAGCGAKGNMITLARDFSDSFELSGDVTRYYNVSDYNSRFKKFKQKIIDSNDKAIQYCQGRGISTEVCKSYELTVKDGTNTLCFPFRDAEGNVRFIKYRNIDYAKGVTKGPKEWCESNCMPILFGMNHAVFYSEPLVITEGQMDSLSLATAGIKNAVSVPTGANGFTWVPHCWGWMQKFPEIIVFGDHEKGKITLSAELRRRFPNKIRTVREDDYLDCKDANEILQRYGVNQIKKAVENAEFPANTHVKDLSTVEKVDIENTEAIKTGLPSLDKILSGGFHIGTLVLLTGKRGDGKSTFMSGLIPEALKQGYATLAYSGELPDFFFKAWLDRQIVGKKEITSSEEDKVNTWYRDRCFIFDNGSVSDGEKEMDVLLKTIEEMIVQKSIRFVCIDNLMTAIEPDPSENMYQLQSKFVERLVKIAKKYNIIILLVAHPRKGNGQETDDNDMVSGSSNITDRADIVIRYQRPKQNEEDIADRFLHVTKNRLTGKVTGSNPIKLWFDDNSKRISEVENNFKRDYLPDGGFAEITETEEIPF